MVDPISLAIVASASAVGSVIGRRTKKNHKQFVTNAHSEEINSPRLHFVSVDGNISPDPLINAAKVDPVFINLQKLSSQEKELVKFLTNLTKGASENSLLLSKVTKDMVLLRNQHLETQVQSISSEYFEAVK